MPRHIIRSVKEFDGSAQICVIPNGWIDDDSFIFSIRSFSSSFVRSDLLKHMDGLYSFLMAIVAIPS